MSSLFTGIEEFELGKQYHLNDIVKNNNDYFFCKKEHSHISLSDTSFWSKDEFFWIPSYPINVSYKFNNKSVTFGKGYGAMHSKGYSINKTLRIFDINFSNRIDKEIKAICFFLDTKNGNTPFDFYLQSPYNIWIKCTCSQYDVSFVFFNNKELKLILEEVIV